MHTTEQAPSIVILGAGHTGAAAAYRAARRGLRVTLLEGRDVIGGVGGSFEVDGIRCDYGSHRFNTACPPRVLNDLTAILGPDLLERPKRSRLRLGGRWIQLPMKRSELLRLPWPLLAGVVRDGLASAGSEMTRLFDRGSGRNATFPQILEGDLGRTLCEHFYFPYAQKTWGRSPAELAVPKRHQIRSRGLFRTLLRNGAFAMLGRRAVGAHQDRYLYPRLGYGQIAERYAEEAARAGARVLLGARVTRVEREGDRVVAVLCERAGAVERHAAEAVWSTIPVVHLVRLLAPEAPRDVLDAGEGLTSRGMILIYLRLAQDHFSEFDTHFIPDPDVPVTRLSEPKNYSGACEPSGRTILCAEMPCDPDAADWSLEDDALGAKVVNWLERAGLPIRSAVRGAFTRRFRAAYPVYRTDTESRLERIETWLHGVSGLVTLGLQGLFSHDDSHHVIDMAYELVNCVTDDGRFDAPRWASARPLFEARVAQFLRSMNGIAL